MTLVESSPADLTTNAPALRTIGGESPRGDRAWPRKHNVCGVQVSATNYDEVVDCLTAAGQRGESAVGSFFAVHAVITAAGDAELCKKVNAFDIVAPDGQPVRWALNRLHKAGLRDRVYGPELMLRMCQRAAAEGLPIYLYGGANEEILAALQASLLTRFPELKIAGAESPPFRPLTASEDAEMVRRVNDSGARFLFIGLGCPKQDHFAADHVGRIKAVQLCVGAAFDFHAGRTQMAPAWMQRNGLEWLYRVCREPRRLWKRYLVTNSVFVGKLSRQWVQSILVRGGGSDDAKVVAAGVGTMAPGADERVAGKTV
ncbi:MAG: WecB/TagA/CpsF family glycosyltransferase [Planctomycetia bacterium]|nr:WecB/TagA/CpsF family glycosyltransferase [Planctomycetia bacterium]